MKPARVAVPVAALLLVAGCGTPSGGTAFSVDGQSVSQRQVDDSSKGCAPFAQQDASRIRPQVAQFLLYGSLADAISKRTNTPITPAMQADGLAKVGAGPLLSDPQCAKAATAVARYAALTGVVDKQRMGRELAALDVKVNPSFGTWDPRTATFTGGSGSLSRQDLGMGQVFG